MQVLILVCSGKRQGNTEKLAAAFARGAREAGHKALLLPLAGKDVRPCLGCSACRKAGSCVQRDGMDEVYDAFLSCDLVAFATPLYFWSFSAQMKIVIDRLYALGKDEGKGYFAYPRKKCVLLATAADTEKHFWVFESLRQYYERLSTYMRWEDRGALFIGGCGGTKAPRMFEETDGEERGYLFGRGIA